MGSIADVNMQLARIIKRYERREGSRRSGPLRVQAQETGRQDSGPRIACRIEKLQTRTSMMVPLYWYVRALLCQRPPLAIGPLGHTGRSGGGQRNRGTRAVAPRQDGNFRGTLSAARGFDRVEILTETWFRRRPKKTGHCTRASRLFTTHLVYRMFDLKILRSAHGARVFGQHCLQHCYLHCARECFAVLRVQRSSLFVPFWNLMTIDR